MAVLFTITSFFGAGLLFTVQPLVARLLLPSYGGSSTVWSTSSLFFQALLLLGYAYSHWSTRRMGQHQPWLHLCVLAVPLLTLPLTLPTSAAPDAQSPALWLLRTLTIMIGLPFVVLATTGPLLQRWYSWGGGPRSQDPYFLFAAGNLGSFGGLLVYPFLIEPHLSLTVQRQFFTSAFVVFVVLTGSCAVAAVRGGGEAPQPANGVTATSSPERRQVLVWATWAFLPSCLMLAVTAHLSTDVASIPMLWVVPLALYLATFVAAFARTSRVVPAWWARAATALAVCAVATLLLPGSPPIWLMLLLDLSLLGVVGFVAHARLAASRPSPEHLTTFYLVIAAGGAVGGLVNGLIAPVVFDRVWEYPLVIAVVPLLVVGLGTRRHGWLENRYGRWWASAVALVCLSSALLVAAGLMVLVTGAVERLAVLAALALVGWVGARRPVPVVVAVLLTPLLLSGFGERDVVARDRTFYGSYVVTQDDEGRYLTHGTTLHGLQLKDDPTVPTTYYTRSGPLGDLMVALAPRRSGIVGLGTGTIAAYATAGDRMTFFEIDQAVVDVASDAAYFSYLRDSPADVDVRVGDGRLLLAQEAPGTFDLVLLDAFSSDAIPVHLLTREAFRLYASRVAADGAVAIHISNRVFDLAPVVASAGRDLGWSAMIANGGDEVEAAASTWVVLTPDSALFERLEGDGWTYLQDQQQVTWTDDYSSVLSVLK